jgi:hypothetical protein
MGTNPDGEVVTQPWQEHAPIEPKPPELPKDAEVVGGMKEPIVPGEVLDPVERIGDLSNDTGIASVTSLTPEQLATIADVPVDPELAQRRRRRG